MQKVNKISGDEIIQFLKIYSNYLENVLYISLTEKGINNSIHIFFMKSFVVLVSKNSLFETRKKILKQLGNLKNNHFNQKFISLNLNEKLSTDYISNLLTIQESIEEFYQAISKFKKLKGIYLKQGVIEFHNFLSHLLTAFSGQNSDKNVIKAINHLYRATIDCYKSIIKEKCDEDCFLKDELIKIREKEIQNLGIEATSTDRKYELVTNYKKIVDKLLKV